MKWSKRTLRNLYLVLGIVSMTALFILILLLTKGAWRNKLVDSYDKERIDSLETFDSETVNEEFVNKVDEIYHLTDNRELPINIDSIAYFCFGNEKSRSCRLDSLHIYTYKGERVSLIPGAELEYFFGGFTNEYDIVYFTDFNFDGFPDIEIITWRSGATGNTDKQVYLFDDANQDFVLSDQLSRLSAVRVDRENSLVISSSTGGGGNYSISAYTFINGKLNLKAGIDDETIQYEEGCILTRRTEHHLGSQHIVQMDTFWSCNLIQDAVDFNSPPRALNYVPLKTNFTEGANSITTGAQEKKEQKRFKSWRNSRTFIISNNYKEEQYVGLKIQEKLGETIQVLGILKVWSEVRDQEKYTYTTLLDKVYMYEDFSGDMYIYFGGENLVLGGETKLLRSRSPEAFNLDKWEYERIKLKLK